MEKILNLVLKYKSNIITFISIIITIIVLYGRIDKVNDLKTQNIVEVNLRKALLDSIDYHVNKYNEVVAEKKTIQLEISELKKINDEFNESQIELINRINDLNADKKVITAALIESNIIIDSLEHLNGEVLVDSNDSTITFKDSTEYLVYNFKAYNVVPSSADLKPYLVFNEFRMPNKQFISFNWDNDKDLNYPISFNVSNSNKYYKTYNINSYAIPELNKTELTPTGWGKFKNWFNKNTKNVIKIGAAGIIGFGIGSAL